jgi:FkbM family methyltransferase
MSIRLSSHPDDIITVVVVFCKLEYGNIKRDDVVVDIGANIGVFSVFAASQKAKRVYAFEPNPEAYNTLCENIKINKLDRVVFSFNLAVSNVDNEVLSIPIKSSPYNRMSNVESDDDCKMLSQKIKTISLKTILEKNEITQIDLCKLDCEGFEFPILLNADFKTIGKIDRLKFECHQIGKSRENLIEHLNENGFVNTKLVGDILWFDKAKSQS